MSLIPLVPSAARTSNGNQDFNGWTPDFPLIFYVDITAVSGSSPNLTLIHEVSPDGSVWYNVRQASYTEVLVSALVTEGSAGYMRGSAGLQQRLRWTITGSSASFTFSVTVFGATEGVR